MGEAGKLLKVNKAAAVIFAADIESVTKAGGLNDAVADIIDAAVHVDEDGVLVRSVPIFFVMNRYKLGKVCRRKAPVSCAAILNYQGANETFKAMTDLLPQLRADYDKRLQEEMDKLSPESNEDVADCAGGGGVVESEVCQDLASAIAESM